MINSMQAEINVAEGKKQVNANIFKLGPIIFSICLSFFTQAQIFLDGA